MPSAQVVLIETEVFRPILRRSLADFAIRSFTQFDQTPPRLAEQVDLMATDLLIAGVTETDPSALRLVADIRWRRIACNPFLPIVITTTTPSDVMIRAIVNAGVDGILIKPFAAAQVQSQIQSLIENRRPFVVTADYIGPERRNSAVGRAPSARVFKVPNPLIGRALGAETQPGLIDRVWLEIQVEYTSRLGFQIMFLTRLADRIDGTPAPMPAKQDAARLPQHLRAFCARLKSSESNDARARLEAILAARPDVMPPAAERAVIARDVLELMADFGGAAAPRQLAAEVESAVSDYLARTQAAPQTKAS